ncbi:MAG: hypothetical protein WAU32_02005 [Thermoanaerobaculia bacterium]
MTSNGTRRTAPVLIAAILGIALGYWIGRSSTPGPGPGPGPTPPPAVTNSPVPATPTPVNQTVVVGPTAADVNPATVTIGYSGHVFWTTTPLGQKLKIVFPRAKFPAGITAPPFEGMLANGSDYSVACGGDTCSSGNVNPNLPHGTQIYGYDQILNGQRHDGRIIIQW